MFHFCKRGHQLFFLSTLILSFSEYNLRLIQWDKLHRSKRAHSFIQLLFFLPFPTETPGQHFHCFQCLFIFRDNTQTWTTDLVTVYFPGGHRWVHNACLFLRKCTSSEQAGFNLLTRYLLYSLSLYGKILIYTKLQH